MKIMDVYRVEDKNGIGPYVGKTYHSSDEVHDMLQSHNEPNQHPCPCNDRGIDRYADDDNERCGFNSAVQLLSWFTMADLKLLAENGAHLMLYPRTKIQCTGRHQVLIHVDELKKCKHPIKII